MTPVMMWRMAVVCLSAVLLPTLAVAQIVPSPQTITANGQTVCWVVKDHPVVAIEVTGTWVGTLAPRVRYHGSSTNATAPSASVTVSSLTANGAMHVANFGFDQICVTSTAWTSGTASLTATRGHVYAVSASAGSNSAASATGAAVPADASYTGISVSGTMRGWTGLSLGSHYAGALAILDGAGNQITSFGGGTQYATGALQASPTGTLALGYDGANLRHLLTNASGHLNVIFPSAQAVSGTVTANAGTGTFTVDSELSAAADDMANPTIGGVLTYNMCFDGTTWDRCRAATSTEATHDGAVTWASAIGGIGMLRASAAAPTDVSLDGDAVAPWALRSGAQVIQPSFAGTLASTGNGISGAGVQRVTLASDSTGQVTLAAGANVIGSLAANQSVNSAQIAGAAISTGNGVSGTGVQRVTIASDSTGTVAATQSGAWNITNISGTVSLPTGAATAANQSTANTSLANIEARRSGDPCTYGAKVFVAVSQTASAQLITGTASNRTYVCSIVLTTATAQNIALVNGTGTTCGTGPAGMIGGATAATGMQLAANGGFAFGTGAGTVAKSTADANNVCLLQSGTGQVSGTISYVVAAN